MSEVKEQGNTENESKSGGLISTFAENFVTKSGETLGERTVNSLVDYARKKYQDHLLLTGEAFNRYLTNTFMRYNQIHTIATGTQTRTIRGKDEIYVEIGVSHEGKTISTHMVSTLLEIKNHIIIEGTGGAGKSMLMRYFFLKTAEQGDYLPIFLHLRQISKQKSGEISILDLIHSSLQDFDREFQNNTLWEQFVYSLNHGKYLFLMDGFDEIKESMAIEAAEKIQKFCAEFPWNACIITTRPEARIEPLETFDTVQSLPLSEEQAIESVKKIWGENEQTIEFCRQLEESLFYNANYNSFASNPLLLSMMGLTFLNHNFIPSSSKEFYEKTFETLYSLHDAKNKGAYRREFQCGLSSEDSFKKIFARFCFQTYLKSAYEFSRNEIVSWLIKSIQKIQLTDVSAEKYLIDLQRSVCMIIRDGDIYRFSHRSFQAYFAAYYTRFLNDKEQKNLFRQILSTEIFTYKEDYFSLLLQIERYRFAENALKNTLISVQDNIDRNIHPDIHFLKLTSTCMQIVLSKRNKDMFMIMFPFYGDEILSYNVIMIFKRYIANIFNEADINLGYFLSVIEKLKIAGLETSETTTVYRIHYSGIDSSSILSNEEYLDLYSAICQCRRVLETRTAIRQWLTELDVKRAAQEAGTFDDLIDNL